jgi:uncharacterized protein YndB with AHSA1/START domain
VIEPLRMSFEVGCPVAHAFDVWTNKISRWWPADHSVSGEDRLLVVLEGRPGGRIFERTSTGAEFEWGEVTVWEPPTRLAYLWHLRQDREDATEVEITFVDQGNSTTRVEIEHRGWERLGARSQSLRDANIAGWGSLVPHYVVATR